MYSTKEPFPAVNDRNGRLGRFCYSLCVSLLTSFCQKNPLLKTQPSPGLVLLEAFSNLSS